MFAPAGCSVHHYHHFDPLPNNPAATIAASATAPRPPAAAIIPALTPVSASAPRPESTAPAPAPPPVTPPPADESPVWRRVSGSGKPVEFGTAAADPPVPGKNPEPAPPPAQPLPTPAKLPEPAVAGDPLAAGLTLDQVINGVLVSDPRLRSGFEAINQANANALTASLRPNPTLFADAQLLPLTRPFTVDRQGGPPQQDAQLSYPIDWFLFGKRAANMAAAAHGVRATEADFADAVRLRVTDAAYSYYDTLEAKALLDLARLDTENLRRVEDALEKGVKAGGKAVIDLNRVRLDRLRAEQTARDAETTLVAARAKLRAMIGRSEADPAFDVAGSLDLPLTADPPPPDEAFGVAVRNRPDIQAIRWKGEQARAGVLVEKRNAYPSVAPAFGYTRQYQQRAIGFPDANSWSAALTMTLPVWDRNQGNRAKAESLLAQNQFDYLAALTDLRAEIDTAAQQLRAARGNAEAVSADQLRLAREVLQSVTIAYQAGGRPLLEFLDAERNFRDTYRTYITVRAAYWRAVARYAAALGQKITP